MAERGLLACYDARRAQAARMDPSTFEVPLGEFTMHLRPSELHAVASGLGTFDVAEEGAAGALVEALRRMPEGDRAPTWELAVRHYGHQTPLAAAAGEIGLDAVHATELLARFEGLLAAVPPPSATGPGGPADHDPDTQLGASLVARVMSEEMLGNAIAAHDQVDLDRQHEASLDAVRELRER